jgi:hypothetical protein
MGVVTIYDWSDLLPRDRLANVDVTTPLGRLLADWTANNRRVGAEYDRRRRAREGKWQEVDPAVRESLPRFDTANITIETVSIVNGVEVLTVQVNPD